VFNDFNQSGKGSVRFVLKTYDDGYVDARSVEYAAQASNTAQALLSCFGSGGCLAQQKISIATGVPLIGPIAGAPALRGDDAPNSYAVRASATQEVERLFSFADTAGLLKMGVLIQDDAFGRAYAKELDKVAERYPVIDIVRVAINPANPDYEAAVDRLQAAQPLSVALIAANSAHSGAFLQTWKRKQPLPFVLNFAGQASAGFAEAIKSYSSTVAFVTVTPSPWGNKYPVQRDYQRITKAAGLPPSYLGFESFLNARALIEAVTQSKAGNKIELMRWINTNGDIDLGGYRVNWRDRRQGSTFTDLAVLLPDGRYRH